ncbi:hypothetical protein G7Y41_02780 [Schaalia sp. ZJ405]|uniref:hypothetical protein n=1 Tax=Schaalia sp. ZJ405 TaxID=2709403 RepID=UPI0013EDE2F8|nr:hypothetical protein [Schaalia sp. ZJ405]QPK81772.1 hypothetical protein G7Y41_02780 [Schaalia sp. ZJ405]
MSEFVPTGHEDEVAAASIRRAISTRSGVPGDNVSGVSGSLTVSAKVWGAYWDVRVEE